ncbi:MAG: NAD(P)-dependent dehydrogenase (short-subunit alcohol dehydrogenase family), partial [Candidatus Promineifilaceae bacterium]
HETDACIKEAGGNSHFIKADISNVKAVKAVIDEIVDRYGSLDIAFNNAGVEGTLNRTADSTEDDFDFVMRVNVKGVWACMKYELQQMLVQGSGCIINTASVAGLTGSHSLPIYSASKHAVVGLTRSAAVEYGSHGIRVNCINPYIINTPMAERSQAGFPPAFAEKLAKATPARRVGEVNEVSAGVLWLASAGASFVNGITLPIDGGYTAQ